MTWVPIRLALVRKLEPDEPWRVGDRIGHDGVYRPDEFRRGVSLFGWRFEITFWRRLMTHHCHAIGCEVATPPKMFMCRRHWFMVPKPLRDRIWATYREGQEVDKRPSAEYTDAALAARAYVRELESATA